MAATITTIAAVAENDVIGRDGTIPWDTYPEDMRRFKRETMGSPVILGRVTFESIRDRLGSPLPGRLNIVVSRDRHFSGDGVRTVNSPASALNLALTRDDEAYVAGGQSIYEILLPQSNRLLLTRVPGEPEGDATFPPVRDDWDLVHREETGNGLVFLEYERFGPVRG